MKTNKKYEYGNSVAHTATLPNGNRISPREAQMLSIAGEGLCNTDIAKEMGISIHTLNVLWRNLREKFQVRHAIQVVTKAAHMGVLELRRYAAMLALCMLTQAPSFATSDDETERTRGGRRPTRISRRAQRKNKTHEFLTTHFNTNEPYRS